MRYLTDRTEIASTINFHKMPTIPLDVSNVTEYGIKGGKLLVDCGKFRDGNPWYEPAQLYAYRDERKLVIRSYGDCSLHAGFGYFDIEEMMENRNLPIIHADEDVLIVPFNSKIREAYAPFVLRTGKSVDPHCTEPVSIEFFDMDKFLALAGFPPEPENKPQPDWEYLNN